MKTITERQYNELVDIILKEREKQAGKTSQPFNGVDCDELQRGITNRLGDSWRITSEQPMKFTKADISAVANARYFRKSGITLLMGLLIIMLLLSIAVKSFVVMIPLYYNLYYTVVGLIALAFIWVYSRGQSKIRKELWRQLGRGETKEG